MGMDLRFQYISPAGTKITGYTEEQFVRIPIDEFLSAESHKKVTRVIQRELEANEDLDAPATLEIAIVHRDGHHVWLEVKASFILDDAGKPTSLIGVARDVTERKKMQGELNERATSYQLPATRSLPTPLRMRSSKSTDEIESISQTPPAYVFLDMRAVSYLEWISHYSCLSPWENRGYANSIVLNL